MRKLLFLAILIIGVIGAGWAWSGGHTNFFLDRTAPEIALTKSDGSARRVSFNLTGTDNGNGLSEFRAFALQNGKTFELAKEIFTSQTQEIRRAIELEPQSVGLGEGEAQVSVELVDSSVWHNRSTKTADIILDYTPPSVSVVSRQFTANQGGAEFILYRVGGGEYEKTGVQVNDYFFRGLPGSAFDTRLAAYPDVHGALIALPFGLDANKDKIEVFVEDRGGNRAHERIEIPVKPLKQAQVNSKLTVSFLERKLPDLIQSYESRVRETVSQDSMSPEALISRFVLINEKYRKSLQNRMFSLIDQGLPKKLWTGVFSRPIPGATTSLFGEQRSYELDGKPAGGSLHEGLDLASVKNDAVHAVNSGVVALAEEFGIYGNAVLIDHGTSLFSLYGHLSSLSVKKGDTVAKDQEIARTGATGLAGGDHLHFEFRVGHVSVNPIEWWDAKWITDNIDGKVDEFLTSFAAPAASH